MGVAQPTRYEPGVRVYVDVVGVLATACVSQNMDSHVAAEHSWLHPKQERRDGSRKQRPGVAQPTWHESRVRVREDAMGVVASTRACQNVCSHHGGQLLWQHQAKLFDVAAPMHI